MLTYSAVRSVVQKRQNTWSHAEINLHHQIALLQVLVCFGFVELRRKATVVADLQLPEGEVDARRIDGHPGVADGGQNAPPSLDPNQPRQF